MKGNSDQFSLVVTFSRKPRNVVHLADEGLSAKRESVKVWRSIYFYIRVDFYADILM